jgi:hypothetical protein
MEFGIQRGGSLFTYAPNFGMDKDEEDITTSVSLTLVLSLPSLVSFRKGTPNIRKQFRSARFGE